jgi:hypothetical protein
MVTFKYTSVKVNDKEIFFPILDKIILVNPETSQDIKTKGLLDSGCNVIAVPKELAELLGVKLTGKTVPMRGIFGKAEGYKCLLHIYIGERRPESLKVLNVECIVPNVELEWNIVYLGQDFFKHFLITFDAFKGEFKIEKIRHL